MTLLDNLDYIKKLDTSLCLESVNSLPDQVKDAWEGVKRIEFPAEYKTASSILFCAMGGSAYGARIIKSLYLGDIKVPVDLVGDYKLPVYVSGNTVVIAASYSGTTEETISCAGEAVTRGAKLICVSSGGELKEITERNLYPFYWFNPVYNPSMQPRLGQGYMLTGQIGILNSLGFIKVTDKEIADMVVMLRQTGRNLTPDIPSEKNRAKQLAMLLKDKEINLIGASFLEGAVHAIRNPFHETAKHFANYFIVPEMNHHLMEGLMYPENLKANLLFVIIESILYPPVIMKRMELTGDIIRQNHIPTEKIGLLAKSALAQVFELIQLGNYVSFYLAMLHNVDPAKIPWVDYFKEQLKG